MCGQKLGKARAAALRAASRGRQGARPAGPQCAGAGAGAGARARRGSSLWGRITQGARPGAAVAVWLRAGKPAPGPWSAGRRAVPAASPRGAMEIGTEISRKIRVRPASAGEGPRREAGWRRAGRRAVVRSNGGGGPGAGAAACSSLEALLTGRRGPGRSRGLGERGRREEGAPGGREEARGSRPEPGAGDPGGAAGAPEVRAPAESPPGGGRALSPGSRGLSHACLVFSPSECH